MTSACIKSDELISISQNIVRKRTLHSITQNEIANHIGVSVGTLSRWEATDFSSTKLSDLVKLINYLESKGVRFCSENHLSK